MRPLQNVVRCILCSTLLLAIASCAAGDEPTTATVRAHAPNGSSADVRPTADPVIVAAGDIVCGNNTPAGTPCKHAATASLIGSVNADAVLVLGDNQYEDGTLAEYNSLYGPTWGVYKSITYPSAGNHEYQTANASGYFDYFNGVGVQTGRAGARTKGYYSYDLGTWHLIALNSNCGSIGGCGTGSAQEVWLRNDLAAHANTCTLAYWHHPLFSSGAHGNDVSTQALWKALTDFNADVVLNGHDHDYERFAPQTSTGVLDNAHGVRAFVVGTGGKEQRAMGVIRANSQLRSNTSLGILKLTLHPSSFDWQFVPVPGDALNDTGSQSCVGANTNQPPVAQFTVSCPSTQCTFNGSPSTDDVGIVRYTWNWGNGRSESHSTPAATNTFAAGTYNVMLTVTDGGGLTNSITKSVQVPTPGNQPPTASITSPANGATFAQGANVSFAGTGSDPEQGPLTGSSLTWTSSRDGAIGTGTSFLKSNLSQGTHTITLTATDAQNATGTTTVSITITAPVNQPPVAGFTVVCGTVPHQCTFDGSSSTDDHGIVRYAWNWGNGLGESHVAPTAKNTWPAAGTYSVTLTVTDGGGLTGAVTKQVMVP